MTAVAFPKPTRPKKPRKALQRKARLEAKHWGVSRGPSKGFPKAERGGTGPRTCGGCADDPCEGKRRGARRGKSTRPKTRASASPANTAPKFPKPEPKRGTKHRRRQREFGRMLFYKRLWCILRDIARGGRVPSGIVDAATDCDGEIQVAHLGDRGASGTGGWRRAPDAKTAPLCKRHHQAIDGSVGGKAPWYVALGREGQRELRADLVLFADFYWRGLTDEQREDWDARAAAQMKARRV